MRLIVSLAVFFISLQNLHCQLNYVKILNPRLNFFDIELLRATVENKKGNVMISPASVKTTLAILLAGAGGSTAKEIEDALRLSSNKEELREQLRLYMIALRENSPNVVLKNANGIFVSHKLKLNPIYEYIVKLEYLSEVTRVDYTDTRLAAALINNWVNNNTYGLIPSIVEPDQVAPPTDIILANALYFKSMWLHAFDARLTKSSCFYRDGECRTVAMMDMETDLNYVHVEELRAHAVELPYEGKRYSMVLLVPLEKDGLAGLVRDLPFVSLAHIYGRMHTTLVTLSMPKFTINYNEDLVDALTKLKISTLFTNKSNLTGIFEGNAPHVNGFHHKTFITVDEAGTEAAASSTAFVVPLMFNGGVQVRADKPFLFFIRDNEFGITLFEGKVEEPLVAQPGPPVQISSRHSVEISPSLQTIQNSYTTSKPKTKGFVESLRSIFG